VVAIHNFVDTDDLLHAILSSPYSSLERIYYIKVDFANGGYSYCTIDSKVDSGSQNAIFIGNTLLNHMPEGIGYDAE
jgi:hypothetical protein